MSESAQVNMNEIEFREQMVAALKRSLMGPESLESMVWPGNDKPATVIGPDFRPKESRPIGPWVDADGQEILDQLPHQVYGVGLLYSTNVNVEHDIPDIAMELDEDDELQTAVHDLATSDESDEESIQLEQRGGSIPQSLAFSVRIPISIRTIEIKVSFATYEEVSVENQSNSWWKRVPHTQVTSLPLSNEKSDQVVSFGIHTVKIGVHVRPSESDSNIVTVWVQNDTPHTRTVNLSKTTLFQVRLAAEFEAVLPYTDPGVSKVTSLDLLYRGKPLTAIGHGCDVLVTSHGHSTRVETDSLPVARVPSLSPDISAADGTSYAIGMQDLAHFNDEARSGVQRIIDDYSQWISQEENRIPEIDPVFHNIAREHINSCRTFLNDMRQGWKLVQEDLDVQECLRHASEAMNQQRIAYGAEPRDVTLDPVTKRLTIIGDNPHKIVNPQSRWRPFQIAFILANIVRASAREEICNSAVDVIWMPTGGGKTEAYLGLSAFVILWERRLQVLGVRKSSLAGTTKVFMRYTYRLLTIQQLTRAASLICALEIIREKNPERYGSGEVRIGCWLGGQTTPNTREQAVARYKQAKRLADGKKGPFVLSKCPWCGAKMADVFNGQPLGYRLAQIGGADRVLIHCPDSDCHFSQRTITSSSGKILDRGIPLLDTDEDLYDFPPDFIVGTVDKVAMMAWKPGAGRLFGVKNGTRGWAPPALLIQDELHLISGSLGSLDGNFETLIEELCTYDGGRAPLIIASTATTKNYVDQISKLYARDARIIPPPGLNIEDSFFAQQDESTAGKVYVGIAPMGFVRAIQSQTGVLALVAHFAPVFEKMGAQVDPYWTNIAFFSSRRSLGMVMSSVDESFRKKSRFWRQVSGLSSSNDKSGAKAGTRPLRRVKQITATASEDVNDVLDQLSLAYPDKNAIDLCYATSMVEVGLDVPRLGLMTVMGQPKGSSQYIQVTGRVGRQKKSPALILVAFNTNNVRDRSHYESFRASHDRLYASVESASVTPYTTQALERSLRSCATALLRILNPESLKPSQCIVKWGLVESAFLSRAKKVSAEAAGNTEKVLAEMEAELRTTSVQSLDWVTGAEPFILGYDDEVPVQRLKPHWKIMRSMRTVDSDAVAAIVLGMGTTAVDKSKNPKPDGDGNDESEL